MSHWDRKWKLNYLKDDQNPGNPKFTFLSLFTVNRLGAMKIFELQLLISQQEIVMLCSISRQIQRAVAWSPIKSELRLQHNVTSVFLFSFSLKDWVGFSLCGWIFFDWLSPQQSFKSHLLVCGLFSAIKKAKKATIFLCRFTQIHFPFYQNHCATIAAGDYNNI